MTYTAFARKYRPKTFEDLIGQSHVTKTLQRALTTQRVAQAYLFAGTRGVGKTSAARILAKCLNCEKGPTPTPCNKCSSCTQITQGCSLDVVEIDGASHRGIDDIRSLRESVGYAPAGGKFRVYIIDEVHMLTTEAFNALLKTLEEPPAHVRFIFATTAPNKVLPTILSRCQRFDFRRIDTTSIVSVLKGVSKTEKVKIEEAAFFAIARVADGSLRDAQVIFEQLANFVDGSIKETDVTELLGVVESEALIQLSQAIFEHRTQQVLEQLSHQLDRGKEPAQILIGLLRHLRNLLVIRSIEDQKSSQSIVARLVDEPPERLELMSKQVESIASAELLLSLQILIGAYEMIRTSPMAQTILELVLIKLSTQEPWQSLEVLTHKLDQISSGQPIDRISTETSSVSIKAQPTITVQPAKSRERAQEEVRAKSVDTSAAGASQIDAVDTLSRQWPKFIEHLGTQKMSLAAFLAHTKPVSLEGETLTIGLPAFELHQEVLSAPENLRLIEKLLGEFCRKPIKVEYGALPEASVTETPIDVEISEETVDSNAPAIVQDIVNLFNATVLNSPTQPSP